MSALTEALRLAEADHSESQFVAVYERHPYSAISSLLSGFTAERREEEYDRLSSELRSIVLGEKLVDAIHHLCRLAGSEEELRTIIAPSYVWFHSAIAIRRQHGRDVWTLIEGGSDFDVNENPDNALNLSPVESVADLDTIMGLDGGFCGGGHRFLHGEDDRERIQELLAAKPLRVTSSGVLLLAEDFQTGDAVPCWKANAETVPDPHQVSCPQARLVASALIREAWRMPMGLVYATIATVLDHMAVADGAAAENVGLLSGSADGPLRIVFPEAVLGE